MVSADTFVTTALELNIFLSHFLFVSFNVPGCWFQKLSLTCFQHANLYISFCSSGNLTYKLGSKKGSRKTEFERRYWSWMALQLDGSEEALLMVRRALVVPGMLQGFIGRTCTGGRKFTGRCNVSGWGSHFKDYRIKWVIQPAGEKQCRTGAD